MNALQHAASQRNDDGRAVTLSSSNTSAIPTPFPISIPPGQTHGTTSVQTNLVTAQTPVVLTATRNGVNRTSVVTLIPPSMTIAGLSLNPTSVIGSNDVVGTVTLTGNAPAWGTKVSLASADQTLAAVPSFIMIPAGANQGSFVITTENLGIDWDVAITATHASISRTATLSIKKPTGLYVWSFNVLPTQFVGPASHTGSVQLSSTVSQGGGVDVLLTSSNPSVASVPASVRVRKGESWAPVTVSIASVPSATIVTLTARYGGVNGRVQLTVQPGQAAIETLSPVLCASTMVVPCLPKLAAQAVVTGPSRYSLYSPELQLLAETEASELSVKPIAYEYVWFAGQPIAQISGSEVHWYFNDHLGTPILQTNTAAPTVWRVDEEPYGSTHAYRAGALKHQPLRFPGQEDSGSELRYNIFRWYRAGWGRYTQGDPLGKLGDPNAYAYALGNPITNADPLGLKVFRCCRDLQVNAVVNGVAQVFGYKHCFIKTDSVEAGLGPANGGPLPACPLGVPTAITNHAGQSQQSGTTCTEITNVDEQCVNNALPIGKKMGPWTPGNNCNNFADNIFKKCKQCGPKNEPFPTPFGPCAKLADGTTVCAGTGI